jgi:hypothetical protein
MPRIQGFSCPEIEGKAFGLAVVKWLYSAIGSINLCPCRPVDFQNLGKEATLRNLILYVERDVKYLKVRRPIAFSQLVSTPGNAAVASCA